MSRRSRLLLEPLLGSALAHGAAVATSVAIAYILVTSLHVTAGEQIPKMFAIVKAERVARACSRPLSIFEIVMRPFIATLNGASSIVLRLMSIDPQASLDEGGTPDDFKLLITQAETGGALAENEADMLTGVFHLHGQQARQVMTPIPAVVTVDIADNVEAALRICVSSGHTRLVVTEDRSVEQVRGTVHTNSLIAHYLEKGAEASIEPLVRDAVIVPETKPLDDLLTDLQSQRSSLAVVIDEYGRTVGLVTVEDIIEEIVGEIDDETDPTSGSVRKLSSGGWLVSGHVPTSDLPNFGINLPADSDAYNSIGGLVFHEIGRMPQGGDTVTVGEYHLRVESVRDNRITAVRIRPVAQQP